MGGGLGTVFCAAFKGVKSLTVVEGLGYLGRGEDEFDRSLEYLKNSVSKAKKEKRVFKTKAAAVKARHLAIKNLPGQQYMDKSSAEILVDGGTIELSSGFIFDYDERAAMKSFRGFTEKEVLKTLEGIECPVLAVKAQDGWPVDEEGFMRRVDAVPDIRVKEVEGSHYCHLDEKSHKEVWDTIIDFISEVEE
ncbi:hypothetical protein TrVE_jg13085 [Triparma verrucosa]|uniref:Uncharacterized protein n=1 Tax=Triparma verrucosa TaxID=1606542 RepID=A0A9W7BF59_9STRA|nr:hypothetical protein TrVE_jg13085 [Triparma verrucosa]